MTHPRRAARALAPALALAAALSGCGSDGSDRAEPGDAPSAAASPAPSPSGTATASGDAVPTGAPEGVPPFGGPAADEFGAEAVMAGYQFAARVVAEGAFDGALANALKPSPQDLGRFEQHMTPQLAREWRADTDRIQAGTAEGDDLEDVFALVTFGIPGLLEGGRPVDRPVRRAALGRAEAAVGAVTLDGRTRPSLVLEFPVEAQLLLQDAGGAVLVTALTKDMTVTLLRTGEGQRPWAIHEYVADRFLTEPRPYPASATPDAG